MTQSNGIVSARKAGSDQMARCNLVRAGVHSSMTAASTPAGTPRLCAVSRKANAIATPAETAIVHSAAGCVRTPRRMGIDIRAEKPGG
jgi:hypothetical protein